MPNDSDPVELARQLIELRAKGDALSVTVWCILHGVDIAQALIDATAENERLTTRLRAAVNLCVCKQWEERCDQLKAENAELLADILDTAKKVEVLHVENERLKAENAALRAQAGEPTRSEPETLTGEKQ